MSCVVCWQPMNLIHFVQKAEAVDRPNCCCCCFHDSCHTQLCTYVRSTLLLYGHITNIFVRKERDHATYGKQRETKTKKANTNQKQCVFRDRDIFSCRFQFNKHSTQSWTISVASLCFDFFGKLILTLLEFQKSVLKIVLTVL